MAGGAPATGGSWTTGRAEAGGVTLAPDEFELTARARPGHEVAEEGDLLVALDTKLTTELRGRGAGARGRASAAGAAQGDAGYEISDRVRVAIGGDAGASRAARASSGLAGRRDPGRRAAPLARGGRSGRRAGRGRYRSTEGNGWSWRSPAPEEAHRVPWVREQRAAPIETQSLKPCSSWLRTALVMLRRRPGRPRRLVVADLAVGRAGRRPRRPRPALARPETRRRLQPLPGRDDRSSCWSPCSRSGWSSTFTAPSASRGPWRSRRARRDPRRDARQLPDRLRRVTSTDFISSASVSLRWPTFNVADSVVVVGIGSSSSTCSSRPPTAARRRVSDAGHAATDRGRSWRRRRPVRPGRQQPWPASAGRTPSG